MAVIASFGRYLPERIVRNEDLAPRLGVEPAWIREMSGIEERRHASEEETVVEMGCRAARDCLSRCGVSLPGLVLVASGSPERRFPGPAAEIAHRLGFAGAPAIDLPMASAGALFGVVLGAKLVADYGTVLVVASERMFDVGAAEPLDKNVAMLFGDGAGACLLTPQGAGLQMVGSVLHSDGAWANDLQLGHSGGLRMNGTTVIMQASRKVPGCITEVLQRNSVEPESVTAFLMHQANQNLIDRVARALGVPAQRFYSNIRKYGNTSSASILIAASEWAEGSSPAEGDYVCMAAFGAGFHWGAALMRARG